MKTTDITLESIGDNIRTQDNRCTRDPMFCVQVCERIGPILPDYASDKLMFHAHREAQTYYFDNDHDEWARLKALYDEGELSDDYSAGGYIEQWVTVQVCFTEEGCKRHLELNGHNYRHYHGVRIYVDCFHRNPEMLAIREFLMGTKQGEK